jgi:hypothetical protein
LTIRNCLDGRIWCFLAGRNPEEAFGPFRVAAILHRITRRPVGTRTIACVPEPLPKQREGHTLQLAMLQVILPEFS